jgi:dienelactone hydrolase
MLERLFHAWERHLVSITKDRKVRPFEWGLDWIPVNGHAATPPEMRLAAWVDEAMADTTAFFDAPPTTDYSLDGGVLRFPSALTTPHEVNNTVEARWFPAAPLVRRDGPRKRTVRPALASRVAQRPALGEGGGRAVLVLPQWNADPEGHIGLSRLLTRCGVSALRMSLPYHDARMPPELTRADYIVSSNIARTIQVCRQAVLDARRAIGWLAQQGYERIGILGTSLGSCLALLTTAHEPRIRAQALNHVSPWFADVVWRGLSTQHVRQGLDGHIDLPRLRELWRPINPFSYMDRIQVRSLLVYARYDLTFPVDLSRIIVDEFGRRGLPHEVAVLPCGHYSTGSAPFKYLDGYLLTQFLRRNL